MRELNRKCNDGKIRNLHKTQNAHASLQHESETKSSRRSILDDLALSGKEVIL